MTTYLPKNVRDDLDAAQLAGLRKRSRLRVITGDKSFRVLRLWRAGFSVEASDAPALRGLVDLYDGATHLYQCLIVASEEERGEMRYEFKRSTPAADEAPVDFSRDPDAPRGLIAKS